MKSLNASELKALVESTGSNFFDRKTMKFFGDTMKNFGVAKVKMINIETQERTLVYKLYRKRKTPKGACGNFYFNEDGTRFHGYSNCVEVYL